MSSPRAVIVCKCAIFFWRNISCKVPQNTEAWPFELAGNSYPGIARRYAPRERLKLVKSIWFNFLFQKRDNYQMGSPGAAIVC